MRFEPLQPVVVEDRAPHVHVIGRQRVEFEIRKGRRLAARAQIDPQHAAGVARRVARGLHRIEKGLVARIGRLAGSIEQLPRNVDLPRVVNAMQRVVLVACQRERSTTVRAGFVEEAGTPVGGAKRHIVFAEEAHALRRSVGDQRGGTGRRDPVFTKKPRHRGTRTHAREQIFLFLVHHDSIIGEHRRTLFRRAPRERRESECRHDKEPSTTNLPVATRGHDG